MLAFLLSHGNDIYFVPPLSVAAICSTHTVSPPGHEAFRARRERINAPKSKNAPHFVLPRAQVHLKRRAASTPYLVRRSGRNRLITTSRHSWPAVASYRWIDVLAAYYIAAQFSALPPLTPRHRSTGAMALSSISGSLKMARRYFITDMPRTTEKLTSFEAPPAKSDFTLYRARPPPKIYNDIEAARSGADAPFRQDGVVDDSRALTRSF
jgi:hypothetical protein